MLIMSQRFLRTSRFHFGSYPNNLACLYLALQKISSSSGEVCASLKGFLGEELLYSVKRNDKFGHGMS